MLDGGREGHGCCVIDENRMIILGGEGGWRNRPSSIYDATSEHSTPLPNEMPAARCWFCAVANGRYIFVIGGRDANKRTTNSVYRLSLETFKWTTLAPMGTARAACAGVLLGAYLYIFGGYNGDGALVSVERYSIVGNTWEDLPDMAAARCGHCAVSALGDVIYILGGYHSHVLEVFDASLLEWRTEASLCDMPEVGSGAAAVVLKNRYVVVIGGQHEEEEVTAGCLIFNCSINQWTSTPACINMITARRCHTAAVLDGKIIVAGGTDSDGRDLTSVECIDVRDVLEYTPLEYPLPQTYFDQILQLRKALLVSK